MFDSELFYFDIVCDVCVYTNFIETMEIIVREFHDLSHATDTKKTPKKPNLSNIINLCEYTFKPE